MNDSFKLFSALVLAVVSSLLSLYCLVGVLQASLLFAGERLVRNWQSWGTATASFLILTFLFFRTALALVRRHGGPLRHQAAGRRAQRSPPDSARGSGE